METTSSSSRGFIGSLANLCAGLVASAEDRLKLLSLELHEEKIRLIQIGIWISAAVFTGMMAVAFTSLTVVFLFWESARVLVLGAFAVFYSLAVVAIIVLFRRHLASQPKPFAATLEELKEDRTCIQPEN
jgi:uncharacterized membrane protein YqjE